MMADEKTKNVELCPNQTFHTSLRVVPDHWRHNDDGTRKEQEMPKETNQ